MNDILQETIRLVPEQPGCYLYYDKEGQIIYVGKAKNLKRRVYSYFHKQHDSAKTRVLDSQIEKLEYIITDSEAESLILESHLIKKHKPKYNILLKDDKKYPYFLITDEDFPRIQVVRKKNLNQDSGRFYVCDFRFLKKAFSFEAMQNSKVF